MVLILTSKSIACTWYVQLRLMLICALLPPLGEEVNGLENFLYNWVCYRYQWRGDLKFTAELKVSLDASSRQNFDGCV